MGGGGFALPVHPRVCGELQGTAHTAALELGSSPRVRGTPGKSISRRRTRTVHPRVCGELTSSRICSASNAGSSPRVRGTLQPAGGRWGDRRFIPACAGNSIRRRRGCFRWTVHPRVCGELACPPIEERMAAGSSPRVRGTRAAASARPGARRFIPACAGNSRRPISEATNSAVHPRVCGELACRTRRWRGAPRFIPACAGNSPTGSDRGPCGPRFIPACAGNSLPALRANVSATGSSPRVRGTRLLSLGRQPGRRFIPACAGNSTSRSAAAAAPAVHPRVCGELNALRLWRFWRGGSSPRVRGTPRNPHAPQARQRFIPACAGNSTRGSVRADAAAVHPRVCGELAVLRVRKSYVNGSSPRVRGTRRRGRERLVQRRFIPACAGNSASTTPK